MKRLATLLLMFIATFAFSQSQDAAKKDSLANALTGIDLKQFEKKRTSFFISRVPANYQIEIITSPSFNYPYTAVLKFPDRPYVEIRLLYDQLRYTNPNSLSRRKIAKQLKKETIEKVKVYDEFLCVNGCDE